MKLGDKIYLSKRIKETNVTNPSYSAPVSYVLRFGYLTVQNASNGGYLEILKFGEKAANTWVAIANSYFFDNVFEEGDLVWLDGETPNATIETTYGNGSSATAVVKSATPINRNISIVLETNQNRIRR